jgi:hypothetical protein
VAEVRERLAKRQDEATREYLIHGYATAKPYIEQR